MRCWLNNSMMKMTHGILTAIAVLSLTSAATAQSYRSEGDLGQPLFEAAAYRRLSTDSDTPRVDVVVETPHDMLQFVRKDGGFSASVEVNLSIYSDKRQVIRLVKNASTTVEAFQNTNTRREFLTVPFTMNLNEGVYQAKILLYDRESGRRELIEREFTVSRSPNGFDLSDVLPARSGQLDAESGLPAEPAVAGVVPDSTGRIHFFVDVQRRDPSQIVALHLTLLDSDGNERSRDSLSLVGGANQSTQSFSIDCSGLSLGRYHLILRGESGEQQVVRKVEFRINAFDLPGTISSLESAIQQLRYIATDAEIEALRSGFPSQREEAFLRFWRDIYPADGESAPGRMREYYSRVAYTNLHYSTARAGWESDRGRIYIIYGSPSEIERPNNDHPDPPVEIWYYHHLGKRFVFRDDYGFGDYRLASPVW